MEGVIILTAGSKQHEQTTNDTAKLGRTVQLSLVGCLFLCYSTLFLSARNSFFPIHFVFFSVFEALLELHLASLFVCPIRRRVHRLLLSLFSSSSSSSGELRRRCAPRPHGWEPILGWAPFLPRVGPVGARARRRVLRRPRSSALSFHVLFFLWKTEKKKERPVAVEAVPPAAQLATWRSSPAGLMLGCVLTRRREGPCAAMVRGDRALFGGRRRTAAAGATSMHADDSASATPLSARRLDPTTLGRHP